MNYISKRKVIHPIWTLFIRPLSTGEKPLNPVTFSQDRDVEDRGFADVEEISWLKDFVAGSPKFGNSMSRNLSTESDIIIFSRVGEQYLYYTKQLGEKKWEAEDRW